MLQTVILFRIIRYGGGAKRNILLGTCLKKLGYIMYEQDCQMSKRTRKRTSVSVRSGHLCWNAVTIFSACGPKALCKLETAVKRLYSVLYAVVCGSNINKPYNDFINASCCKLLRSNSCNLKCTKIGLKKKSWN